MCALVAAVGNYPHTAELKVGETGAKSVRIAAEFAYEQGVLPRRRERDEIWRDSPLDWV